MYRGKRLRSDWWWDRDYPEPERPGFTNRFACYLLGLLAAGLLGGFVLAWRSINYNYMGALACWTVCFTPLGTACSVVLCKVVDKSRAENTAGGIVYETAMQEAQQPETTDDTAQDESPPI